MFPRTDFGYSVWDVKCDNSTAGSIMHGTYIVSVKITKMVQYTFSNIYFSTLSVCRYISF